MHLHPIFILIPIFSLNLISINTESTTTRSKPATTTKGDDFQPVAVEFLLLKNFTDVNFMDNVTYQSIQGLSIENSILNRLPMRLTKKFPNLKELVLINNVMQNFKLDRWNTANEGIIAKLERLHIEKQKIEILLNNSFSNYENLKSLSLVCAEIDTIEDNAFKGLSEIEILDLSGNKLKKISSEVLTPLTKLKTLVLTNNQFNSTEDIIGNANLTNLETLNVENNPMKVIYRRRLTKLHKTLPKLNNLKYGCQGPCEEVQSVC